MSPLAAVYGASLGRTALAGMAVTVIGFPSWRCGRACSRPHRKEQPSPPLIHRNVRKTPARSVKKEFKERPSSYLRCMVGIGLLTACTAASVPTMAADGRRHVIAIGGGML